MSQTMDFNIKDEDNRPDPELLLKKLQIQAASEKKKRGSLKIFFGYSAGVGKTYAMLEAAHEAKQDGIDVVAGYIEPHARPETMKLMEGLEQLRPLYVSYKNIVLHELDLDGALKRRPQLILVDELAHTNAKGCRHIKRYQDIEELLKAGIDVYTTVNVQHLESLNDIVQSITGVQVRERIPDFVFDQADEVELVDIEPKELLVRLREGKIYKTRQAGRAMENFFTVGNLTALREIALRRTADQVNQKTEKMRVENKDSEFYTGEHILVCLSPSPSNVKVIRAGARMAKAFKGKFTAVHVEVPGSDGISDEDDARLQMNERLAQQLGAKVVTLYGGDITKQIAEYARVSGVSKIVLGRSYTKRSFLRQNISFSQQLTQLVPKMEVYLIPDTYTKKYKDTLGIKQKKRTKPKPDMPALAMDVLAVAGVLTASTLIAFLFQAMGFDESNIITVYILGVLLTALLTVNQICSLIAAAFSVCCFNFFFTEPVYTLMVYKPSYIVTFVIMFISGFITAVLAKKVKNYGTQAAKKAYRTDILLETSLKLQKASGQTALAQVLAGQLYKLLDRDIVYYSADPMKTKTPLKFAREADSHIEELLTPGELGVAAWVYQNNKHAGATTGTLSGAKGLYIAVRNEEKAFGVIGIYMGDGTHISAFDESIMLAIFSEGALAMEADSLLIEHQRENNCSE